MNVVINMLLFQAGWFACVLGAAHDLPWLGAAAAVAIVAWHLARAIRPARELALIATALLVGAVFETLLLKTGWVRYTTGLLLEGIAPYWMVALWANFATTLNVSLRALRSYLPLAALLGAIGGPAAYWAGAGLGAMEFVETGRALTAIGLGWAILAPALVMAARRFDGYAAT